MTLRDVLRFVLEWAWLAPITLMAYLLGRRP